MYLICGFILSKKNIKPFEIKKYKRLLAYHLIIQCRFKVCVVSKIIRVNKYRKKDFIIFRYNNIEKYEELCSYLKEYFQLLQP